MVHPLVAPPPAQGAGYKKKELTCHIGNGMTIRHWSHSPRDGSAIKFGSFYVGPESAQEGTVPMIIWLHGGPHSVFQDRFMPEIAYFLSLGYAVLAVNYR